MDPITLALATFGIQKLRGKSTKRSFRDALIAGGIGQLGSMTKMGQGMNLQGFGTGAGQLGAPQAIAGQHGMQTAPLTLGQQFTSTPVGGAVSKMWGKPAVMDGSKVTKAATGVRGWSTGAKLGAGPAG